MNLSIEDNIYLDRVTEEEIVSVFYAVKISRSIYGSGYKLLQL